MDRPCAAAERVCSPRRYYGVTLLISYMEGDAYINQFLGFALEAPALLAATLSMARLGRRSTAVVLMLQGVSLTAL